MARSESAAGRESRRRRGATETASRDFAARLRRRLPAWYRRHRRDLPWRRTRDPYAIWLSEIMLQQTQVATVIPYYERFVSRFPTVQRLAAAPLDDVLRLWSGLGYYARARHLHAAAKRVVAEHDGRFPDTLERLSRLPGIGRYTAAAIASIAFDRRAAVLDGNVSRVLARLFAVTSPIKATITRNRLWTLAESLTPAKHCGDFNQAMMELGATLCSPKRPQCLLCPVSPECEALAVGRQNQLPVKLRSAQTVRLEYTLLLVRRNGCFLLRQRNADSGNLVGFWEAPCTADLPAARMGREVGRFKHSIMHHEYRVTVRFASVVKCPPGFRWIGAGTLEQLPLTTATKKALKLL
ncbi:MAG: A/G-specific adenine glycosylase [Phycisphaerae bacterium]|nr:A/G-specific adenine glycosylase [Phycisphaerae bacterium]